MARIGKAGTGATRVGGAGAPTRAAEPPPYSPFFIDNILSKDLKGWGLGEGLRKLARCPAAWGGEWRPWRHDDLTDFQTSPTVGKRAERDADVRAKGGFITGVSVGLPSQ